MLWDGSRIPRLALHQARLTRSAEALGWTAPPQMRTPPSLPTEPRRLRLTLAATGALTWEVALLPPAKPLWRVGLSPVPLSSTNPWLGVKSTRRALYDQSRAALPQALDEVIFRNERAEVCEGTITTVFFDRGQGLRTPPLTCGLLPGVLRAALAAREEVLLVTDLPHVRLWLGNALRGLIPATFIA